MVRVLPIHFGVVLDCKGGGGKKKQIGPEKFFQAQPSKTELRARYSTMAGLESLFWRGIRWRKEGGGKKKLSGPESLCLIWASETRQHRQDKPRQANTSQHKPRAASKVRWPSVSLAGVWLKLSTSIQISLGPNHVCHRHGSSAARTHCHSFGK